MSPEPVTTYGEEKVTAGINIDEAMLGVYRRVGYVIKTPSPELRYSYASETELIAALRPAMVAEDITVSVTEINNIKHDTFVTTRGTTMNRVSLIGIVTFWHAPSGTSRSVMSLGEGMDTGDKATYKALTGMYKYALRQSFCIETGDDPDKHSSADMESVAAELGRGLAEGGYTGKGDTYHTPKYAAKPVLDVIASARPKYASGRPIGTVEEIDGQLMIECPTHGWTRAREFVASGTRPARTKCTRNDGTREAPAWCEFGVSPTEDGIPVPDSYYWIPAYNELLKVNGDVVNLSDIATVIGVERATFNEIDRWLKKNPERDIYGLFEEASVVHELRDDVDYSRGEPLPFSD